jgi:hypothetical protein
MGSIDVYLEIGKKGAFAGAVEWPGWCRIGRNEESALQALLDYAPRYALVLQPSELAFEPPVTIAAFNVVERLPGNATTDFGAPDMAPTADSKPIDEAEQQRFQSLLTASWQAFDAAVQAAEGKELRQGPRGGGRDLEGIVHHILEADMSYLSRLAWKYKRPKGVALKEEVEQARVTMLNALAAAARGETPATGPRGGVVWRPRYFVRRVAWHLLDHLWEIEDRVL